MFRKLLLLLTVPLALAACDISHPASPSDIPAVGTACAQIKSDKFDLALKSYGAATDAINLLIDAKVIVPGTPRAVAIADANDKVLAAFSTAEHARQACNATSYSAALNQIRAGLADVQSAMKK